MIKWLSILRGHSRYAPQFQYHLYKMRAQALFATHRPMEALQDLKTAFEINSGDLSTLTWIPPAQVAACPNQEFKDGMLQMATNAIEKNPAARASRMQLAVALGKMDIAREDMAELAKTENATYRQFYELAMYSLADGRNLESYKSACHQMLAKFADSSDLNVVSFTGWTCISSPVLSKITHRPWQPCSGNWRRLQECRIAPLAGSSSIPGRALSTGD